MRGINCECRRENRMEDYLKKDFKDAVAFWDSALGVSDEEKQEILDTAGDDDWKEMVPARKLYDAVEEVAMNGRVLDYGCGQGWGALAAAKLGCSDVTAVDMAESAVELVKVFAKAFKVDDVIKAEAIDEKWLASQPDESYDVFLCSNVIDVVPLEIAEDILDNAARVLKKGGKAVIGLNFYMAPETAKEKGLETKDDRYLYDNGILRLILISDEEWTEIIGKRFTVEKLDHFAWPGESKEGRRLFLLRK